MEYGSALSRRDYEYSNTQTGRNESRKLKMNQSTRLESVLPPGLLPTRLSPQCSKKIFMLKSGISQFGDGSCTKLIMGYNPFYKIVIFFLIFKI